MRFIVQLIILSLFCTKSYCLDRADSYRFAEYLRSQKEYYRAITEYYRGIYESNDPDFQNICRYRIGVCYLSGHQCKSAISLFQSLTHEIRLTDTSLSELSRYRLAEAYYCAEEYKDAISTIQSLPSVAHSTSILQPAIYSGAICYLKQQDCDNAIKLIKQHAAIWPDNTQFNDLSQAITNMKSIRFRKPAIAGVLSSIIPGSGQIYAGRLRDGLTAFVVNSLFIAGIISAVDSDHRETAWILGFFEAGWYTANIYNAMNDTHKTNKATWESHLHLLVLQHGTAFPPIEDSDL